MSERRVRAVVFDLFGTLIPNIAQEEWDRRNLEIAGVLGVDPDAFTAVWRDSHRDRMDGSLPDGDHIFAEILARAGVGAPTAALTRAARLRTEFIRACIQPKHDAIESLRSLRDAGLKLALATDCSSGTPALLDETDLGRFFPIRAVSALLGVTKPHPKMYRHVLDGLGLEGSECLFVGDGNSYELRGAKEHGFTSVWVDNGGDQRFRHNFDPVADHKVRELSEVLALAMR